MVTEFSRLLGIGPEVLLDVIVGAWSQLGAPPATIGSVATSSGVNCDWR